MKEEELTKQEVELKAVLDATEKQIKEKLDRLAETPMGMDGSALENFRWFFEKERLLYNTLNMFKFNQSMCKGLCWCPIVKVEEVNRGIEQMRNSKKVLCSSLTPIYDHTLTPPTYFRCNDFLRPFQEIVFTYGVASYREANPTLFTIITFPFLFGIMFGDLMHGLVLLTLSAYICINRERLIKTKSMLAEACDFRYLLLLMGFFSAFCGFLYNDFAAVPLNLFSTCFNKPVGDNGEFDRYDRTCVYPVGFDPKWYSSVNELQFINSFKMKISVIVGVAHMVVGIFLKGLNSLSDGKHIDFWFEFLPQFIFMVAFFGYMNFMIIIKWLTDWSFNSQNGPSIITLLIGIPLKGSDPGDVPLYDFENKGALQQSIGQNVLRNVQ